MLTVLSFTNVAVEGVPISISDGVAGVSSLNLSGR